MQTHVEHTPTSKSILDFKLLVVEDNPVYSGLVSEMLDSFENIQVEKFFAMGVQDGEEQFNKQNPDVVFLDISLIDGNGLNLLEKIIAINPDAYVVMMTADGMDDTIMYAFHMGAKGYIVKPFQKEKIEEVIHLYKEYIKRG